MAFKEGTSQDVKASAYLEIKSDHLTKNGNTSPNSYLQLTRRGRLHVLSLLPLQGWHEVERELHQRETDLQLEIVTAPGIIWAIGCILSLLMADGGLAFRDSESQSPGLGAAPVL